MGAEAGVEGLIDSNNPRKTMLSPRAILSNLRIYHNNSVNLASVWKWKLKINMSQDGRQICISYLQNLGIFHQHLFTRNANIFKCKEAIINSLHTQFCTNFTNFNTWKKINIQYVHFTLMTKHTYYPQSKLAVPVFKHWTSKVEGIIFLQNNVNNPPSYKASYPKRLESPSTPPWDLKSDSLTIPTSTITS